MALAKQKETGTKTTDTKNTKNNYSANNNPRSTYTQSVGKTNTPATKTTSKVSTYQTQRQQQQSTGSAPKINTTVPKATTSAKPQMTATGSKNSSASTSRTNNVSTTSVQTNRKTQESAYKPRSSFKTDADYENYLVENRTDFTKGDAFKYAKEKASEQGLSTKAYIDQMRNSYRNTKDVEKIQNQYKNNELTEQQKSDIDNSNFGVVLDSAGNEVDSNKYYNDVQLYNTTSESLQKEYEKLDKSYTDGKIDYNTYQNQYNELVRRINENEVLGDNLRSMTTLTGFDYYDWAKENGRDVKDFESYIENVNDSWFERLGQSYVASLWDTASILPETASMLKTLLDPDYDLRSDSTVSTQMKRTASELREYAHVGRDFTNMDDPNWWKDWTLTSIESLMPMINSTMLGMVTGTVIPVNTGKFTNVSLGVSTAGQVMRQRLDEGNNVVTAFTDGVMHGIITGLVEGLDMGKTINLFTGNTGKYMTSLALLGKPSVMSRIMPLMQSGREEGREEIYETLLDYAGDTALNITSTILNSLGVEGLQQVNVEDVELMDLANQYAMSFFGSAVLGMPATAINTITDMKRYNATVVARDHFETTLREGTASPEELELAKFARDNANYCLENSPISNSKVAQAVELPEDEALPLPTYNKLMNDLANVLRPDIQGELRDANETYKYAERLRNNMQNALNERGVPISAENFMDEDSNARKNIMETSKFLNNNNVEHLYLNLPKGMNGVRLSNGVLINTNQAESLDIDKIADLDKIELGKDIKGDVDKILVKAGLDPNIISTSFHEASHYAERSDLWKDVKDMVEEAMGKERFKTAGERIEQIYKAQNLDIESPDTEVVAFYLQKNIDNKKFLERMARYNSSFLNRFVSNALAQLKGDQKTKLENLYMDAIRDAQNSVTQELAPSFSAGSLFQAIGMTIHKESETLDDNGDTRTTFYATDANGNKVREVTPEMVKNSPLGQMLQHAQDEGFIKDSSNQEEMVATIYNSILKSQDPEMFWAMFGSIGFNRARVGTSSWDVSQKKKFSAFTENSDPQYGHTFDVTTICTKTQQLIDVASEVMKKLGRGLTEQEIIDVVYKEVFEEGEPVPCPVCYVFSRWVGLGGVLNNIKNFQEKYKGADLNELRDRYEKLSKQVDEIAKKRGIRGSKALDQLRKETDQEVNRRYEDLFSKDIVEKMGGDKLSAEERAEFESLKKDLDVLNDWSWLTRVLLDVKAVKGVTTIKVNEEYLEKGDVPDEILFNLNKGEDFSKYPAWKYRASRGQRYGKIIAPYSDMVLGQTVLGFASPSSISDLGQRRSKETNAFLDMDNTAEQDKIYEKAVENAKVQNLKNGSRAQSTSDFRFEYITDYILHFMQLQTIGSYGQTYTKVPEAVPVLCSVGYEVNMSLMPKGKGYKPAKQGDPYAYYVEGFDGVKDGWYTIDCSSVTGINPDVAFYLRNQYDNAQTIMVGINPVHHFLCRQDPRIDFIIPYHASGGSAENYASMMESVGEGESLTEGDRIDYAEVSNENEEKLAVRTEDQIRAYELRDKILAQDLKNPTAEEIEFMKQGTGILYDLWERFYVEGIDDRCYGVNMGKGSAIYPYEYWDELSTRKNADVNGMRYVQYCKELGFKPKFDSLSNGDGSGGYWKYLPDRSMYNVDGTSHIQKAINMDNFSSDFLYKNKLQEGIVQPIAEERGIEMDENNPLFKQLRKEVLSQQFNKTKTKKIANNVLDVIKEHEVKAQFSAGGVGGLKNMLSSGDMETLKRGLALAEKYFEARIMDRNGANMETIWDKTGWIKKEDQKWRFQFYDGAEETLSKIVDLSKNIDGERTLGALETKEITDFIDENNILFKMYPELKDIYVGFYASDDGGDGFFDKGENDGFVKVHPSININMQDFRHELPNGGFEFKLSNKEALAIADTFFHELQHAIQNQEEGFERGSNLKIAKEERRRKNKEKVDNRIKEIENQLIGTEGINNEDDVIGAYYDFKQTGGKNGSFAQTLTPEQVSLLDEYSKLHKNYDELVDVSGSEAFAEYFRNVGEREAREEAERALNSNERKVAPKSEKGTLLSERAKKKMERSSKDSGNELAVSDGGDVVPPKKVDVDVTDGYSNRKKQQFRESNLEKSTVLDEKQKEKTRQMSAEGMFTYQSYINDVEVNRAKEYMERDGIDKTFNDYMASNDISMKTVVKGEVLLQKLAQDNDPRWEEVAIKLADDSTIAGQALQAYAILQRMSPEGQLTAIHRNMRRMQDNLDRKYGRRAPHLEISTELENELRTAKTAEEAQKARDKIMNDLIKQQPITFSDMIDSWRYLAMLGNPRTHVRNFLGNAVFMPAIGLKNAIGTALETAMQDKLKYKTKAIVSRFADKELYQAGQRAYENHRAMVEKTQKYEQKGFTEKTWLGKFLNKADKTNTWLLDHEDYLFSGDRYALSYAQFLKANGLTPETITEDMDIRANQYALAESLKATYRDANAIADWLNELERSEKGGLKMLSYGKKAVLPFTKTPFNIVKRGFEYSGLGLLKSVVDGATAVRNGTMDMNTWIDEMSAGLSGTALMGLGWLLANMGLFGVKFRTKDDDKDRKKYFDRENGEQDYSLDFGKFTYTMDWATPVIMSLAMGAEFGKVFDELGNVDGAETALNAFLNISANLFDPVVETSMLSSLQDAMSSYSNEGGKYFGDVVASAIASYIGQMFPTLGGQVARIFDDTRRITSPNTGLIDKTKKQILNKIPYLGTNKLPSSKWNQPYINKQGQEEKTEDLGMKWFGRAILNLLSPGYYSSKDIDKYDDEMLRLYEDTGEIDVLPSSTTKSLTYDKEPMKFSDEEYTQWHKTRYSTESKYVNQFMDSNAYKQLTDEERVATIKDIREYAREVAKKEFLESRGKEYESKNLTNASNAVDNGIELYAYYDYLNNAGSKQADKLKYLEDSNLTDKQKKYLYDQEGYKTSYEDVYKKVFGGESDKSSSKKKSGSSKKSNSTSKKKKVSSSGVSGGSLPKKGAVRNNLVAPSQSTVRPKLPSNYLRAYSNSLNSRKDVSTASRNTTVCPNCGNRVPSGATRCPVCGRQL